MPDVNKSRSFKKNIIISNIVPNIWDIPKNSQTSRNFHFITSRLPENFPSLLIPGKIFISFPEEFCFSPEQTDLLRVDTPDRLTLKVAQIQLEQILKKKKKKNHCTDHSLWSQCITWEVSKQSSDLLQRELHLVQYGEPNTSTTQAVLLFLRCCEAIRLLQEPRNAIPEGRTI